MARSEQYLQGKRAGLRLAIARLHERAKAMDDPKAKAILNSAAFDLGQRGKAILNFPETKEIEPMWRGGDPDES